MKSINPLLTGSIGVVDIFGKYSQIRGNWRYNSWLGG